MIKLIGVAVVAVGFALRLNPLFVVLAAGLATGLAAGLDVAGVVAQFGTLFVENRYLTLPVVLIVPVIGLLERNGLQEYAAQLIRSSRAATAGRVLWTYTAIRQVFIALGVKVGGHAEVVRPLVAPMAEGAARARLGELPLEAVEQVRAHAAAAENVGNFFGEDVFVAVGAVLLMKGFFESAGYPVGVWSLALWGLPTAVVAFAAMGWRCLALDRRLARSVAAAQRAKQEKP
jgi:uncharacterized membrane protein